MTHLTQDDVLVSRVSPLVLVGLVLGKDEVRSSILRGGTRDKRRTSLRFPMSDAPTRLTSEARIMRTACGANPRLAEAKQGRTRCQPEPRDDQGNRR